MYGPPQILKHDNNYLKNEYQHRWNTDEVKKIGAAVKFIQGGGVGEMREQLFDLEKTAKRVLDRISEGLKSVSENIQV